MTCLVLAGSPESENYLFSQPQPSPSLAGLAYPSSFSLLLSPCAHVLSVYTQPGVGEVYLAEKGYALVTVASDGIGNGSVWAWIWGSGAGVTQPESNKANVLEIGRTWT
jgi:hypothetical protein